MPAAVPQPLEWRPDDDSDLEILRHLAEGQIEVVGGRGHRPCQETMKEWEPR